jgi:hypothetical protein
MQRGDSGQSTTKRISKGKNRLLIVHFAKRSQIVLLKSRALSADAIEFIDENGGGPGTATKAAPEEE